VKLIVARSKPALALILIFAAITIAVMLWAQSSSFGTTLQFTQIFTTLFVTQDRSAAIGALLILFLVVFSPVCFPGMRVLRWCGEHPGSIALASVAVLCAGNLLIYRNHPLSMDEYAAYFQSRVFAAGHLAGQFPPQMRDWLIPPSFQGHFLSISALTGEVVSPYWPSFALLLAPFTALGAPWACNAVISGATLLAIHRLTLGVLGRVEGAGAALLLTLASPEFFANGISYYSMPAHLLANTLYALLLLNPTRTRALLAGVTGSIALTLHNPLPHMLFALPWLLWVARRKDNVALIGCLVAGYLPLSLLLGIGWFLYASGLAHDGTGVAGVFPFSLPDAQMLWARLVGVAKIWVWSVPGLMVLAAVGAWRWRQNEACRALLGSALITLLGYCIVPFDQGHGWGYRYFHSAWMVLPILGAAALLPVNLADKPRGFATADVAALVVVCALLTLTAGVGLRAWQMNDFIREDLANVPGHQPDAPRVLLLNAAVATYEVDLIQNDPWLRGNVVRMLSYGPANNRLMMAFVYPDMRRIWSDRFGEVWSVPQSDAQ
jgi:hypothetical protein